MAIPAVFAVFAGKKQRRLTFSPQESWAFRASVNQKTAEPRRRGVLLPYEIGRIVSVPSHLL
jgi:hypothetical protein